MGGLPGGNARMHVQYLAGCVTNSKCWVMATFKNLVIKITFIHSRNSFWIPTLYLALFSGYLKMYKAQPLPYSDNRESALWTIRKGRRCHGWYYYCFSYDYTSSELMPRPVGLGWVVVCMVVGRASWTRFCACLWVGCPCARVGLSFPGHGPWQHLVLLSPLEKAESHSGATCRWLGH